VWNVEEKKEKEKKSIMFHRQVQKKKKHVVHLALDGYYFFNLIRILKFSKIC